MIVAIFIIVIIIVTNFSFLDNFNNFLEKKKIHERKNARLNLNIGKNLVIPRNLQF